VGAIGAYFLQKQCDFALSTKSRNESSPVTAKSVSLTLLGEKAPHIKIIPSENSWVVLWEEPWPWTELPGLLFWASAFHQR